MTVNSVDKLQFSSCIFAVLLSITAHFIALRLRRAIIHQHTKILLKLDANNLEMSWFFSFPDGNWPPCWVFNSVKFSLLRRSGASRHITVPKVVKINRSMRRYLVFFLIFKITVAAILDFWNRKILLTDRVQRVKVHQWVKISSNRSIGCEDIKIFWFFKCWRRHLGQIASRAAKFQALFHVHNSPIGLHVL